MFSIRALLLVSINLLFIPRIFGAPCQWALTATSPTAFGMLGGTGTARLTTNDAGCDLPAIRTAVFSGPDFITITSMPASNGAELTYRVAPNSSWPRSSVILLGITRGLMITQEENSCVYSQRTVTAVTGGTLLPDGNVSMSKEGGTVQIAATATADGCPLEPLFSDGYMDLQGTITPWATLPKVEPGRSATVTLTVSPNTSNQRRQGNLYLGKTSSFASIDQAGLAEQAFGCRTNFNASPLMRAGGLSEYIGRLELLCDGQVPPGGILGDVHVKLSTPVTSAGTGAGAPLEALLLLDLPMPAQQFYSGPLETVPSAGTPFSNTYGSVYQGRLVPGTNNEVVFTGVPIALQSGPRQIMIVNLRSDVTRVPLVYGDTEDSLVGQTLAQVSIVAPVAVSVTYAAQAVGYPKRGLKTSTGPAVSINPGAIAGAPLTLGFTEGYMMAFRPRGSGGNIPGLIYPWESGFVSPATGLAGTQGLATTGTRLMAAFTNVPNGVQLSVPERIITGQITAQLVSAPAANGSGGTPTTGSGTSVITAAGGTAVVVYEVTELGLEPFFGRYTVTVPALVTAPPGTAPGVAEVTLSFAPLSDVNTVSDTAPVPRFRPETSRTRSFAVNGLALSPLSGTLPGAGGPGNIRVIVIPEDTAWSPTTDAAWVTLATTAAGVTYSAGPNPTGMPRTAVVRIGGERFTLTQQPGPNRPPLSLDTESLRFRHEVGGTLPAPQDVGVVSDGPAVSLTPTSSAAWLKVGMTSPVTPAKLRIGILPTGLAPGTYYGTVGMEGSFAIQVVLVVAPAPHLRATPAAVAFQDGGGEQVVFFTGGDRPLPFSVRLPSGAPWLQVLVVNDSRLAPANLRLRANPAGLAPGTYQTTVEIVAPEAKNSPLSIPVTLTVSGAVQP